LSLTALEPMSIGAAVVRADWLALDSMWVAPTPSYRVRIVCGFKPIDVPQRIQFCNQMTKNIHVGLVVPLLLLITDEA
jgi:hypothetical protein